MQFATLAGVVLVLAQIGAFVMGSPASPQPNAECSYFCKSDADCAPCPEAGDPLLQYTCLTLDLPDLDGVRLPVELQQDAPVNPELLAVPLVVDLARRRRGGGMSDRHDIVSPSRSDNVRNLERDNLYKL